MPVVPFNGEQPVIAPGVFIAADAWVIGKAQIDKDASVFFGAVLRGDIQRITVGEGSNLQEHAILHTSTGLQDCEIGRYVTVGHRAIIHGCTIRNNCIIGMGATILDGAIVGENSIVGAQSLVPMNTSIPPGKLAYGVPVKVMRDLTREEIQNIHESAVHYIKVAQEYRKYFSTVILR